jgi:cellulose synthase/poly-beta-1,6-N-acetylglucosamine synthase-like glycosyltransferase
VHLVVAVAALLLLSIAQLYAFTQLGGRVQQGEAVHPALLAIVVGALMTFTVLSLGRQALLMTFACWGAIRSARRRYPERARWPGVSLLVPAFNEGPRIAKALESILALDYPTLEIIVVDDGSTDDTFARATAYAGQHGGKRVRVVTKQNGGKWSALNLAFHSATEELVVCVDADSQLLPDSLKLLARHFDDPSLGGCCGKVAVRNCSNLVTRLQALEYHVLNGLLRQAQSAFSMVLVAPGPLSMFRRSVLTEVWKTWGLGRNLLGPWEPDTFAEDADLTLSVLLTGHGVRYEPLAVSRTTAPDWTFRLLNQRYRWTRGNFQAAVKAWKRWQEAPDPPQALPLWLGTFLIETVLWPAANLLGLLAFIGLALISGLHGSVLIWFLVLVALDVNEAAFSARLEGASLRSLAVSLVSRVYFNVLLDVNKAFALVDELRGTKMRWS